MKKNNYTFRSLLTLLFCLCALSPAWAAKVETTASQSSFTAVTADNLGGDTNISYASFKGGGTSDPQTSSNAIRLYQNSAGTGGGYITISAAEGCTITSATIGSDMATSVAYTLDASTTKSDNVSLAKGDKYTVNSLSASSISFYCMGTNKNSRLYVNYLEVTYEHEVSENQVATPKFTIPNGTILCTDKIEITCETEDAIISYKIGDGEAQTYNKDAGFTLAGYSGEVAITASATKEGFDPSTEATATYTVIDKVAVPTFSPENGSTIKSNEKVTINCATEGAKIYYSLDDNTYTEYTEPITLFDKVEEGVTEVAVYAKAEYIGANTTATSSDVAIYTYEVVESDTYKLVTDVTHLAVGDEVIIVNNSAQMAISTNQKSSNRGATAVTITDGKIAILPSDIQVITLGIDGSNYTLYTGTLGYLHSNGDSNGLKTQSALTDNGRWTISIAADGVATIKAITGNKNWLRYNPNTNGDPLFSCYGSGQQDVAIYKKAVPTLRADKTALAFGEVMTNETSLLSVSVYADNLTATPTYEITGEHAANFSIVNGDELTTSGSVELQVMFDSKGVAGTYNDATLTLSASGVTPVTIALSAEAIAPEAVLEVDKSALAFSANWGITTAVQSVVLTVKNATNLEVTLSDDTNFGYTETVLDEEQKQYDIFYTAPFVTGENVATLSFKVNEIDASIVVNLTGTAIDYTSKPCIVYEAITSLEEIDENVEYYMAVKYEEMYYIANVINGDRLDVVGSTSLIEGGISFQIEPTGTEKEYNIRCVGSGSYLGANEGDLTFGSEYAWTISESTDVVGTFNILSQANDERWLAYNDNNGNGRFKNYKSTYEKDIILYRAVEKNYYATTVPANGAMVENPYIVQEMQVRFAKEIDTPDDSKVIFKMITGGDYTPAPARVAPQQRVDAQVEVVPVTTGILTESPNTLVIKTTNEISTATYQVEMQEGAVTFKDGSSSEALAWQFTTDMSTAVEDVTIANTLLYNGREVVAANGAEVEVYNMAGTLVARRQGSVSLDGMAAGVYVARSGNSVMKLVK